MQQLIIKGEPVDITINKRRGLRRLTLRIDMKTGKLKISAPWLMPQREILYFLREKANWIEKNIEKFRHRESQRPKLMSGEKIMLQGQEYILQIQLSDKKRTQVSLEATEIIVRIWNGTPEKDLEAKLADALQKFYKNLASQIINSRLEHFNQHYNYKYNKVSIKDLKSRWGSCSIKKNLNFNWKLVMAPLPVLDYVVVHELCHLKELNHSKNYWALVAQTTPDHKKHRKWLREHGTLLTFK